MNDKDILNTGCECLVTQCRMCRQIAEQSAHSRTVHCNPIFCFQIAETWSNTRNLYLWGSFSVEIQNQNGWARIFWSSEAVCVLRLLSQPARECLHPSGLHLESTWVFTLHLSLVIIKMHAFYPSVVRDVSDALYAATRRLSRYFKQGR